MTAAARFIALVGGRPEWRDHAACRGMTTSMFYPAAHDMAAVVAAKAVCARCPVTRECLDAAMAVAAYDDRWGVFGGLSAKQRQRLRGRRFREARARAELRQRIPAGGFFQREAHG